MLNSKVMFFFIALFSALLLGLSDPIFRLWPMAIIAYSLVSWVLVDATNSKNRFSSAKNLAFFFFFFWFFQRSLMIRSAFIMLPRLYDNSTKGIFVSLIIFSMFSIASALYAFIYRMLFVKISSFKLLTLMNILFLILANQFNQFYLPQSPEALMGTNNYLLSAFGFLGTFLSSFIFFTLAYFLGLAFYYKSFSLLKKTILALSIIMICLMAGGFFRIKYMKNQILYWQSVALVQTNDSILSLHPPVDFQFYLNKIETALAEKRLLTTDRLLVVFPEYSMENIYSNNVAVETFLRKYPSITLVIGVSGYNSVGLTNQMSLVSFLNKPQLYEKNFLFPLGERELSLPLIPREWLKPSIPVSSSNSITLLKYQDRLTLLPMICYESSIPSFYDKLIQIYQNENVTNSSSRLYVNISMDSFYENTSLMEFHSHYAQWNVSRTGIPMVRVSTTGFSEVIAPWGEVLARTGQNQFQILFTKVPIL